MNKYYSEKLSIVVDQSNYFFFFEILYIYREFFLSLEQRTRSQSQQKLRNQEDVCVRISLPPLVEGPVYASLICHIPKLRWNAKHQSLCRFVNIKVTWWGEDDTSAVFK